MTHRKAADIAIQTNVVVYSNWVAGNGALIRKLVGVRSVPTNHEPLRKLLAEIAKARVSGSDIALH